MSLKVSLYESYICASMNKNVLLEWSKHHELPSKDGLRVPFKFKQWKLFQKLRIGGFKKVISYGLFELFFGSTNPIYYTKNHISPPIFFLIIIFGLISNPNHHSTGAYLSKKNSGSSPLAIWKFDFSKF